MGFFSSITDAISDVADVFTSAVDDVATFATDNLPLVVAAVAAYYGIPASAVGATEIAGAEAAGAITASEAASAASWGSAESLGAIGAGAAGVGAAAGGGFDLYGGLNAGVGAGAEAYGAAASAGAAAGGGLTGNALGLQQMGMDAGLTGSALSNFVASGGGATIAGGAGGAATTSLIQQLASYTGLSTGAIERLGGAAISSLAGLYGANKLGQASMDAANRLAGANQTATQLQSKMYEDQVARQQPFYQAGVNALPDYTKGVMPGGNLVKPFSMADYQADPGYGFRMSEGMKALDRSAASRGGLLSGATIKGAERYNQDLASQEYNNAYNRYVGNQATQRNALAGLTGFAPTAAQQIGAAGTNYANTAGNLGINTATNYGNADLTGAAARQSAYAGAGGAFNEAFNPDPRTAFYNNMMRVG